MADRRPLLLLLLLTLALSGCATASSQQPPTERFAFVRQGDLWLWEQGQERRLVDGEQITQPRFSHDGRFIHFREGDGLKVVSSEGAGPWPISDGPPGGPAAAWSPTDNTLAIATGQSTSTVAVRPDGPQPPRQVVAGWSGTAWSPDGRRLAVSRAKTTLTPFHGTSWVGIVPREGGEPRVIAELSFSPDDEACGGAAVPSAWSVDQDWLLLVRPGLWSSLSADCNEFAVVSTRGGPARTVGRSPNTTWAAWSPTAPVLALTDGTGRDAYWRKRVLLARPPWTQEAQSLTPEGMADREPAWHPSGRFLAFTRSRSERPENMNAPAPGQAIYQTETGAPDPRPVPSSQGSFGPFYGASGSLYWFKAENGSIALFYQGQSAPLIRGLDLEHSYYGQWNWRQVLDAWGSKTQRQGP